MFNEAYRKMFPHNSVMMLSFEPSGNPALHHHHNFFNKSFCPEVTEEEGTLSIHVYEISDIFYRVSINSFPDYKHLLQENYVEYKHIFFTIT